MAFHAKDLYTADGSTQSFAVTFPFISRDHVSVTADAVAATFTWVNNGQITITSPAALATEALIIKRSSSPTALLVDFVDGSNLTEADLDLLATQMFYLAQENIDENGSVGFADLDEFDDAAVSTTAADLLISNGTEFDNVAVTGDVTISSTGVTTIGASKVTSAMILADEIVDADINSAAGIDATKIGGGGVTTTEFDYLATVTSNVQTQLDNIVAGTVTTLTDSVTTWVDGADTSKKVVHSIGGATTAKTMTLTHVHTDDRALTFPDATDTLVGKATTDTLTNKTLTAPVISTISNTGVTTLFTDTDTVVGKATTDTLTNKTITALKVGVNSGVTASAGSVQGGEPITVTYTEIATCATAGDSVTLPTAAAGLVVVVANNGAESADVFPASGDDIDKLGVDAAYALASGTNTIFTCQDTLDWDTISGGVGRGETTGAIGGLKTSNDGTDADHDINIAVGFARDYADTVELVLASSLIKQGDATWAVGTNAGGMDSTDTIAASTGYGVYLIGRSDTGVVDVMFSSDMTAGGTALTLPANYDQKRLIGWVRTNSSANFMAFIQSGDYFNIMSEPELDLNDATITDATFETVTLTSPPLCLASVRSRVSNTTSTWAFNELHLRTKGSAESIYVGNAWAIVELDVPLDIDSVGGNGDILTNSTSQIEYATYEADGVASVILTVIGCKMLTRSNP